MLLALASPSRVGSGPLGQAEGDRVQPWPDRFVPTQRASFAGQNNERGLENIVCVGRLPQDSPADPVDEPGVPLYQRSESGLIAAAGEPLQ